MKNLILILTLFICSNHYGQNISTNYELDKAHSRLGFKIKHREIVDVNGEFSSFNLDFKLNEIDWKTCVINLNAKSSSINTGIENRDNHLKSEDFFDAENYPEIIFKSNSVSKRKNKISITGNLTMHGITKNVTFSGVVAGPIDSKNGKVIGLQLSGPVKRSDFKIGKVSPGLADEVFLHADIEMVSE